MSIHYTGSRSENNFSSPFNTISSKKVLCIQICYNLLFNI